MKFTVKLLFLYAVLNSNLLLCNPIDDYRDISTNFMNSYNTPLYVIVMLNEVEKEHEIRKLNIFEFQEYVQSNSKCNFMYNTSMHMSNEAVLEYFEQFTYYGHRIKYGIYDWLSDISKTGAANSLNIEEIPDGIVLDENINRLILVKHKGRILDEPMKKLIRKIGSAISFFSQVPAPLYRLYNKFADKIYPFFGVIFNIDKSSFIKNYKINIDENKENAEIIEIKNTIN